MNKIKSITNSGIDLEQRKRNFQKHLPTGKNAGLFKQLLLADAADMIMSQKNIDQNTKNMIKTDIKYFRKNIEKQILQRCL